MVYKNLTLIWPLLLIFAFASLSSYFVISLVTEESLEEMPDLIEKDLIVNSVACSRLGGKAPSFSVHFNDGSKIHYSKPRKTECEDYALIEKDAKGKIAKLYFKDSQFYFFSVNGKIIVGFDERKASINSFLGICLFLSIFSIVVFIKIYKINKNQLN